MAGQAVLLKLVYFILKKWLLLSLAGTPVLACLLFVLLAIFPAVLVDCSSCSPLILGGAPDKGNNLTYLTIIFISLLTVLLYKCEKNVGLAS